MAGPLANLWIGIDLTSILFTPGLVEHDLWRLIVFSGTFCLIASVHNLLPFQIEDRACSDGARILQFATRSMIVYVHLALKGVQMSFITPPRARDFDLATLQRASEVHTDDLTGIHLRICTSHHFRECGKTTEAIECFSAGKPSTTSIRSIFSRISHGLRLRQRLAEAGCSCDSSLVGSHGGQSWHPKDRSAGRCRLLAGEGVSGMDGRQAGRGSGHARQGR